MGKLTRTHIFETAIWLTIALVGYYYSFKFDANIEIYKFGASGWPRAVLAMIVIAALGNLYWHYLNGEAHDGIVHHADNLIAHEASSSSQTPQSAIDGSTPTPSQIDASAAIDTPHDVSETRSSYYLRIIPIIVLPFLYGYFLEGVGFYSLTPPFIALIIFVMGERSMAWLLGITALIYGLLLFLFAKILFVGLPVGNWRPFYDYGQWLIPTIQNNYILEFLGLALVIPLAIFSLTRAKGEREFSDAIKKTLLIYTGLFAAGTGAAYLLGGPAKAFILFDVLKWPLSIFL